MPNTEDEKNHLTDELKDWLENYLKKNFLVTHNISVEITTTNLNILQNEKISTLTNVNLMTFHPDILGILEHKKSKKVELVFIFRDTSTIGFTMIGEILLYSRLVNPKIVMMVSTKNLSDRVDEWINHKNKYDVIRFHNKKIIIFKWDSKTLSPDKYSITPIEAREDINQVKN
jgi:hypothetical protein